MWKSNFQRHTWKSGTCTDVHNCFYFCHINGFYTGKTVKKVLCEYFLKLSNTCQIHNLIFFYQEFIKLDKLIFLLLAQLYTQFSASIFQCRQIIRHVLFSFFYLYLLFYRVVLCSFMFLSVIYSPLFHSFMHYFNIFCQFLVFISTLKRIILIISYWKDTPVKLIYQQEKLLKFGKPVRLKSVCMLPVSDVLQFSDFQLSHNQDLPGFSLLPVS